MQQKKHGIVHNLALSDAVIARTPRTKQVGSRLVAFHRKVVERTRGRAHSWGGGLGLDLWWLLGHDGHLLVDDAGGRGSELGRGRDVGAGAGAGGGCRGGHGGGGFDVLGGGDGLDILGGDGPVVLGGDGLGVLGGNLRSDGSCVAVSQLCSLFACCDPRSC
jgi:hypothetical protein